MGEIVWCAKHKEGWCAVKPNRKFSDDVNSVVTQCGYFISLPWGCELRTPTCEECRRI